MVSDNLVCSFLPEHTSISYLTFASHKLTYELKGIGSGPFYEKIYYELISAKQKEKASKLYGVINQVTK